MKKTTIILIVLAILTVFVLIATAFLLIRKDIAFRLFQRIRLLFSRSDCQVIKPDTESVPIKSLPINGRTLMLINKDHRIPEGIEITLTEIDSHLVSSDIVNAYQGLCDAITERYDDTLRIRSSYRTKEEQEEIYGTLSPTIAAEVNASEHQLGLSLDIFIDGTLGGAILKTSSGRFLHSHCYEYGFIIRYPYGKSDITGISYEPWHIRYVGKPHAEIMYKEGLTLEEYLLEYLTPNVYYQIGSYYISRQIPENESISLPKDYTEIEISPDNCGGYIVTALIESKS